MVNKEDAIEIISYAEDNGIDIWLDGGWGVDALLGRKQGCTMISIYLWKKSIAKNL
jgi:hypothetical protein